MKLGWKEGSNLRVELRWGAADPDRTKTLAKELVDLRPDVILGQTTLTVSALADEAALQAAKKRGQRLGSPGIVEAAKLGRAALKANARRFAANVRPIIDEIVRAGATSHNAIAAKLNERNVRTARGGVWTPCTGWSDPAPFRWRKRRRRMTAKAGRQRR
jgi:hypothetical protein